VPSLAAAQAADDVRMVNHSSGDQARLLVEGPEIKVRSVGAGQWSMRERFCAAERQAMIGLYISGATSSQVAERFGISVSSVKRVLRSHGIRKRAATTRS
jgi:hypothetical protein